MPKPKPILFSGPMVRAILDGAKTQTRRIVSDRVTDARMDYEEMCANVGAGIPASTQSEPDFYLERAPFQPGDVLWVRETWTEWERGECACSGDPYCTCPPPGAPIYRADFGGNKMSEEEFGPWKPCIFMPKKHCRIFLKVTGVRVERIANITKEDAVAEGMMEEAPCPGLSACGGPCSECTDERGKFRILWDSLNAKRGFGWDENPWVWVYEFERTDKPADWPESRR